MIKRACIKVVFAALMAMSMLASALVLPVSAAGGDVVVGITSDPTISGAAPGGTAVVPIIVYNATDLAAGTLIVTYNSSVCNVTTVTAGEFFYTRGNTREPGIVILSAMNFSGHKGMVVFANLEIKAVGDYGETSPLNISVETLYNYGPPPERIPAANISVSNGTFTIREMI